MIISGYYGDGAWQQWFHKLWWANNFKYLQSKSNWMQSFWSPKFIKQPDVYIVSNSKTLPRERFGKWITLEGDLGHADDLLTGRKPFYLPGAVGMWMIGAWIAYSNECDLIYLEEDCLVF